MFVIGDVLRISKALFVQTRWSAGDFMDIGPDSNCDGKPTHYNILNYTVKSDHIKIYQYNKTLDHGILCNMLYAMQNFTSLKKIKFY